MRMRAQNGNCAMNKQQESLQCLREMGFPTAQCEAALQLAFGDQNEAVQLLLSGVVPMDGAQSQAINAPSSALRHSEHVQQLSDASCVGQASLSQYSLGAHGRSACTSIAIEAARLLLPLAGTQEEEALAADTNALTQLVMRGAQNHAARHAFAGPSSSMGVDHEDARSVLLSLSAGAKGVRVLARAASGVVGGEESVKHGECIVAGEGSMESAGTRQGVLADPRAPGYDTGIAAVLREAQAYSKSGGLVAVVLTKPPESLLAVVPPESRAARGARESQRRFAVFDSHPRPALGLENAHLLFFDSIEAQARWLQQRHVFPYTDIGAGMGMLAETYNLFDATFLRVCHGSSLALGATDAKETLVSDAEDAGTVPAAGRGTATEESTVDCTATTWVCATCTFINCETASTSCAMCGTTRMVSSASMQHVSVDPTLVPATVAEPAAAVAAAAADAATTAPRVAAEQSSAVASVITSPAKMASAPAPAIAPSLSTPAHERVADTLAVPAAHAGSMQAPATVPVPAQTPITVVPGTSPTALAASAQSNSKEPIQPLGSQMPTSARAPQPSAPAQAMLPATKAAICPGAKAASHS